MMSREWRIVAFDFKAVPGFPVVDEASDGMDSIARAPALRPDVVLLEIDMSLSNGIFRLV
jgi:DNA-binding NarL/FixJ family response regulator